MAKKSFISITFLSRKLKKKTLKALSRFLNKRKYFTLDIKTIKELMIIKASVSWKCLKGSLKNGMYELDSMSSGRSLCI